MSETQKEYFGAVSSFDILDYGYKDMEKKIFCVVGYKIILSIG